jgi:hypothetical protein
LGIPVAAQAAVTPGWECIPTTAGEAVVSGGTAPAPSCKANSTPVLAPTFVSSGVGGKPTVEFSAVNVQIVNGSSSETTVNGSGNLILGYDEKPGPQSGSHNLLLGGSNSYSSYGGLVGGTGNSISNPFASILGGTLNVASGNTSTILGGYGNHATSIYATIAGGCSNLAGAGTLPVSPNCTNTASFPHGFPTVLGGAGNQATGPAASVTGGDFNIASSPFASVDGGSHNNASAKGSSVLGGEGNTASTICQAIPAAPINGAC